MTTFHNITDFTVSASSDFSHGAFFVSHQDIKSGQSPLMHAVESNNADMVHFLIEVMRLCVGREEGGEGCDSALFDKFGFLFPAHKLYTVSPFFSSL